MVAYAGIPAAMAVVMMAAVEARMSRKERVCSENFFVIGMQEHQFPRFVGYVQILAAGWFTHPVASLQEHIGADALNGTQ